MAELAETSGAKSFACATPCQRWDAAAFFASPYLLALVLQHFDALQSFSLRLINRSVLAASLLPQAWTWTVPTHINKAAHMSHKQFKLCELTGRQPYLLSDDDSYGHSNCRGYVAWHAANKQQLMPDERRGIEADNEADSSVEKQFSACNTNVLKCFTMRSIDCAIFERACAANHFRAIRCLSVQLDDSISDENFAILLRSVSNLRVLALALRFSRILSKCHLDAIVQQRHCLQQLSIICRDLEKDSITTLAVLSELTSLALESFASDFTVCAKDLQQILTGCTLLESLVLHVNLHDSVESLDWLKGLRLLKRLRALGLSEMNEQLFFVLQSHWPTSLTQLSVSDVISSDFPYILQQQQKQQLTARSPLSYQLLQVLDLEQFTCNLKCWTEIIQFFPNLRILRISLNGFIGLLRQLANLQRHADSKQELNAWKQRVRANGGILMSVHISSDWKGYSLIRTWTILENLFEQLLARSCTCTHKLLCCRSLADGTKMIGQHFVAHDAHNTAMRDDSHGSEYRQQDDRARHCHLWSHPKSAIVDFLCCSTPLLAASFPSHSFEMPAAAADNKLQDVDSACPCVLEDIKFCFQRNCCTGCRHT